MAILIAATCAASSPPIGSVALMGSVAAAVAAIMLGGAPGRTCEVVSLAARAANSCAFGASAGRCAGAGATAAAVAAPEVREGDVTAGDEAAAMLFGVAAGG